jgi:hypothetical protein
MSNVFGSFINLETPRGNKHPSWLFPKPAPLPSRRAIFCRPRVAQGEFGWKHKGTLFEEGKLSHDGNSRKIRSVSQLST